MASFGDRLIERTRALGHPLCVGLDPYLHRIPSLFRRGAMHPQHPDTAEAAKEFCCRVIDVIASDVAVVKPRVSLFECLGWRGWQALERVIVHAHAAGLLVLLDAKRGDIADTATAYAQAYLSQSTPRREPRRAVRFRPCSVTSTCILFSTCGLRRRSNRNVGAKHTWCVSRMISW